jgi:hypothetical protein
METQSTPFAVVPWSSLFGALKASCTSNLFGPLTRPRLFETDLIGSPVAGAQQGNQLPQAIPNDLVSKA